MARAPRVWARPLVVPAAPGCGPAAPPHVLRPRGPRRVLACGGWQARAGCGSVVVESSAPMTGEGLHVPGNSTDAASPGGGGMKVLRITPERCTGCMRCELACSYVQTGTFQPAKSVIRISPFEAHPAMRPIPARSAPKPGAWSPARWKPSPSRRSVPRSSRTICASGVNSAPLPVPMALSSTIRRRKRRLSATSVRAVRPCGRVPDGGDRVRRGRDQRLAGTFAATRSADQLTALLARHR